MSTYDASDRFDPTNGMDQAGGPQRMSGLAIAALVCSLVVCIPVLPLLGVILGLVAVVTMIGKEQVRGRGIAIAAIVLGLVFSIGWAVGGFFLYKLGREFVVFVTEGPSDLVEAAIAGDHALVRSLMAEPGASASDAEIDAFVAELTQRYGTFVSLVPEQQQQNQPTAGQVVIPVRYVATFDAVTVPVLAELSFADERTGQIAKRIVSIEFEDPDRGDLRFPKLPPPPDGG